jgi:signal transduction histidine kinase
LYGGGPKSTWSQPADAGIAIKTMSLISHLKNNRILVIDDNPSIHGDIRKILHCGDRHQQLRLEKMGAEVFGDAPPVQPEMCFQVDGAMQGEEGMKMIEAAAGEGKPYAMAFIDVRMPPGLDGVETIGRIWKRFPDLQVVICTAFSDYSWEEMIRQIGRSDDLLILKKPFDNIEVLQLANALTQKWSLNQQLNGRLKDLDHMVQQRTQELQSANEQLKREMAEQKRLENQLRQSQKMEAVGQLAAGIAHDFNNILTVIQGNASLLLAIKAPSSPDCRPLQNICAASERAAKLVSQLLTFCRKQVVELRPGNLRDIVTSVAEMLPRALTPMMKVDTHAPRGLPLVNLDTGMMETLLMNLAVNARDAMPNGGTISITAKAVAITAAEAASKPEARAGEFVCLSVRDTGTGIPPEVLPRIFEPFFTTKPVGKGTGLGLATVYGIVKQHQGWIEVQSKVDQGTVFQVYLPALPAKKPAPPVAEPNKQTRGRETILVVDDEPDLRELVTQVLESDGYHILSAGSGEEAMEIWSKREGPVHLLLTDMVMPDGLTGRKLAERLKSDDSGLKVIYTSGYSAGIPGNGLTSDEEEHFLPKPYRPATLLRLVRDHLDRRGAEKAPTAA